jgi:hypothetical protein
MRQVRIHDRHNYCDPYLSVSPMNTRRRFALQTIVPVRFLKRRYIRESLNISVADSEPDPDPSDPLFLGLLDPDPSIIKQKD